MLKAICNIGIITTSVFIGAHMIKENKENVKKYCPIIKYTQKNKKGDNVDNVENKNT
jgi:hypothetical protein